MTCALTNQTLANQQQKDFAKLYTLWIGFIFVINNTLFDSLC